MHATATHSHVTQTTRLLTGKTAIVTGGNRGIGAAIARRLADSGADVVITYYSAAEPALRLVEELVEQGATACALPLDIAAPEQIKTAIAEVAGRFGKIDILVNNAGLALGGMIETIETSRLMTMLAANVTGVFHAIQQALAYMPEGGRIVNIGSIGSDYMPYPGNSLYVMTKSAVSGLTKGLSRELAQRSITINNVQPGRIDTDMLRNVLGDAFEQIERQTPLGRFGEASEVAEFVHFLCGPGASYITGANLRVDGGVSA